MIVVYEADGSVEAHLIKNMLAQANIESYIHGESLTGGIGDLQTMGLVRVMVNETDYEIAREIVEDWGTAKIVDKNAFNTDDIIPDANPS